MRRPRFVLRSQHILMPICSSTLLAAAPPLAAVWLLASAALLAIAPPATAQERMTRYPYENRADIDLAAVFEPRWDVMVPMRDGVRLHTEIYVPRRVRPSRCPSCWSARPTTPTRRSRSTRSGWTGTRSSSTKGTSSSCRTCAGATTPRATSSPCVRIAFPKTSTAPTSPPTSTTPSIGW